MDVTIVFGCADFKANIICVTEVLKHLLEAGMQVNPDKCNWFSPSVTYLKSSIAMESSLCRKKLRHPQHETGNISKVCSLLCRYD